MTQSDNQSSEHNDNIYNNIYNWLTQLQAQAIALTLLLLALMTVLTVGVAFFTYRQISLSLAESRDQELAVVGAERLSSRMANLMRGLSALADQPEMQSGEPTLQEIILNRGRRLVADFTHRDGGIIILDSNGFVSITRPFRPDLIGHDFSEEPYFQQSRSLRTFYFSNIIKEPGTNQDVIVIAVPIVNIGGDFVGTIAGRFYVGFQGMGREIQKLKVGNQGITYLVDRDGKLIYHPVDSLIGTDFSHRQAVIRLEGGDREGAIISQETDQPSTVEGYATLPITGWRLIVGEPWEQVVQPAQAALKPSAIVFLLGLIVMAGIVSVVVKRVTDPIQNLVIQTRQVTAGDYGVQVRLSRIKEIRELGRAFNEMVQQIRKYRAGVQQYVADITHSQEEERKRIARELHDDTVQSLIAIGQRIELIKGNLNDVTDVNSRLGEVRLMVTSSIASVRQFSRDLRPLALEDLGLTAAMQLLVNRLAQSEDIEVNLKVSGQFEGLSGDMEVAVYRILQETLNNVKKHARATKVKVTAEFTEWQIRLIIQDDGRGFDVPENLTDFANKGSFGVMGLQERAQLFGGKVVVRSETNKGTTVQLTMPRVYFQKFRPTRKD